jgi:type-IV secretion system protein TraC
MEHRPVTSLKTRLLDQSGRLFSRLFASHPPGAALDAGALPPTIEAARRLADAARVSGLLPYRAVIEDAELYRNTDSVGFMLEASPATGIDPTRLNVLTGLVTQGIKNHTTIQISLFADPHIHELLRQWEDARASAGGAQGEALRRLARRRVEYLGNGAWESLFGDQPFLLRDWRVFISFTRPLLTGARPEQSEIDYLIRTREAFKSTLQSAGMSAMTVQPDRLIQLLDGILQPTPEPKKPLHWDPEIPLADQMAERDSLLLVGRDSMSLLNGDRNTTLLPFSVRQYPKTWAGWGGSELLGAIYNNVLRLPCPVLVTQTIHFEDQVAASNKAKMKAARATQMNDSPAGRFVPAWKERKADWDFVTTKVGEGHKLLRTHYQILAFAPHGEEEHAEQKIKAVYDAAGWALQKDRFSAIHAFRAALPMGAGPALINDLKRLGYLRTMLTWNAINTAPVVADWKGTGRPLLMFFSRRGQIQFVDPFDNLKGNFNVACAATSGSGKSFLSQEMINSMLATGGRVWVIDAGRSYRNLCRLLGGTYIEFSKQTDVNLNPFSQIKDFDDELPVIKQIIAQMASPATPLDSLQLSWLEQAMRIAWDQNGTSTEVTHVAEILSANSDQRQQNLGTMLYPWTNRGSHGRFFAGKANIDLDKPFIVLELDDLNSRPDLQGVVLMILMLRITETMYLLDRKQRKLCIIDEAWRLLGNGAAGDFIEAGYRTARKYGGAFMTITQGIDDYYESASARAALNCSDWVWLLRQKPESLAAAADNKRLFVDESAQQYLMSLDTVAGKYSEVAIRSPEGLSIGRLVVDRYSEKLYSTKAEEVQFIEDALAAGQSVDQAVDALVNRSQAR